MTKHKLDQDVEDILQHYGIKGMKWGVRRTDAEIAAAKTAEAAGGGGDGEEEDEAIDTYGELFEALGDKLGDKVDDIKEGLKLGMQATVSAVSKAAKTKGRKILDSIFSKDLSTPMRRNTKIENAFKRREQVKKKTGMSEKEMKAYEKGFRNPKKLPGSKW